MKILMAYLNELSEKTGGAEKVLCEFSNAMVDRHHSVAIMYEGNSDKKPYYWLSPSVKYFNIKNYGAPREYKLSNFQKIHREIIRLYGKKHILTWYEHIRNGFRIPACTKVIMDYQPDVIVVYDWQTNGVIYGIHPKCPVISMIHTDPSFIFKLATNQEMEGLAHSKLIQVLAPEFIDTVHEFIPNTKVISLPDPITQMQYADEKDKRAQHIIINVARLQKEAKRQHILIKAFAQVAQRFPDWKLEIWGKDKDDYEIELRHLIHFLGLGNRVFLKGVTPNIENVYRRADIFALTSVREGFCMALGEAMSAGIPAVAFRSCPAIHELIDDGVNGIFVDDGIENFARGLEQLMKNSDLRIALGNNAHEKAKKFAPDNVWNQWEKVLMSVYKG